MYKALARLVLVAFLTTFLLNSEGNLVFAEQQVIQITSVETQILPEYDTPDILVINAIQIQNKSNQDFNNELRWIVPSGSNTHIVIDEPTRLQFNLAQNNRNTELVFKLAKPLKAGETRSIHLEYYFNNFQGNVDKSFSFKHVQLYPIVSGQIYVFQPTKASNFRLTPDFGAPQAGQFTYYQKFYSNLQPGQDISFTAAYTKQDPNPSVLPPASGGSSGQPQNPDQERVLENGFDKNIRVYIIGGLSIIIVLLATKIISNRRKLAEYEDEYYEDDEEDDEEDNEYHQQDEGDEGDEEDEEDEEEDDETELEPDYADEAPIAKGSRRAKIEQEYRAGRITEEEYNLLILEN